MKSAVAHAEITFTVTCPECGVPFEPEDNWDIYEYKPLLQDLIEGRFGNACYYEARRNHPTISEEWIINTKDNGYKNPYVCPSCGADFEIKEVSY